MFVLHAWRGMRDGHAENPRPTPRVICKSTEQGAVLFVEKDAKKHMVCWISLRHQRFGPHRVLRHLPKQHPL